MVSERTWEGEEVGDGETEHEGDQPHRDADARRREVGLERGAQLGVAEEEPRAAASKAST